MTRYLTLVAAAAVLFLPGCGDHSHEGDRGPGPVHEAATPDQERPAISVTVYQDGLELFMEYPSFVTGEESPLVAHLTDTRDPDHFRVIKTGKVTAELRYANGIMETFVADDLLRDGIFKPVVTPGQAGDATLSLRLEGEQAVGRVDVGAVVIHADVGAAMASAPAEEGGERTVPFLKEQQWKTEYATALVEPRALRDGVGANGELKAVAGQAADLSAPVAGRIPADEPVPFLGQAVAKGEVLVRLIPTSITGGTDLSSVELEFSRARSELGLAEREFRRAQEMLAARAIPEKQVDTARVAREVGAARLSAAERQRSLYRGTQTGNGGNGEGSAFELRSPIDGVVSFADVMPGSGVEAGRHLVSVVNSDRLWLETRVYESDAPRIEHSPGASFVVAGFDREFVIDEKSGRRVAVGAVVDRATRTVPVVFEFPNPGRVLKPGMFAKANLFTGESVRDLAIPNSAIVDDNGKPTVFVMSGGESFFKRVVRIGIRSGGHVQVLEGVTEGERVVTRGAYEMKLSTATGAIPEHGHQH